MLFQVHAFISFLVLVMVEIFLDFFFNMTIHRFVKGWIGLRSFYANTD